MLMAMNDCQQLINAATADRQLAYQCPGCSQPVRLKRGSVVVPHFAHVHVTDCHIFSEGETAEHLCGKQLLATWFAASGYKVRLEAELADLHQRPDVLVQRATAPPLALEFQCAPLSVDRLAARTHGYWRHGYQVLWLLGRPYQRQLHLNSKALKFLQYQQQWGPYLLFLHVTTANVQLLHHILTLDAEPLSYQSYWLNTKQQSVTNLRRFTATIDTLPLTTNHLQRYYQYLMLARLRHQHVFEQLQAYCYHRGGTIAQLPSWTIPTIPQLPILAVPYLVWHGHVFGALRQRTGDLTSGQLRALIWHQLRPLLARRVCLHARGQLLQQQITVIMTMLVDQRVIIKQGSVWQINAQQLKWRDR
ncbi:competence protein CoiA family protein [Lactiplantibacillus paraplantarum]|uniref:competence protein CoiA n=1 Tax=Lactiplantibacillus paraplantarum TaxID=60520 RepID=UPI000512D916|nr:competence protein CoiA family protein [Lactiplantibacillus paraplantarum]OAX75403.1 competence protein [Lactiplantibacillus plantarum]ALO04587.1 competence protein [Lactiplantibacillus paraplantarum]KGE75523.1 competence protein [Lactiplantibacillus paraplantarum]MCW1910638.1 competence protein CoiA family protein [Lactiplantibacillus paraplantarum]RDG11114.1 competence protein [Lactiplantibacillus paraplantarum]